MQEARADSSCRWNIRGGHFQEKIKGRHSSNLFFFSKPARSWIHCGRVSPKHSSGATFLPRIHPKPDSSSTYSLSSGQSMQVQGCASSTQSTLQRRPSDRQFFNGQVLTKSTRHAMQLTKPKAVVTTAISLPSILPSLSEVRGHQVQLCLK